VEGSPHAKNQLDSSSSFDTMSACDEQTDGQTALAYGRAVKSVGPSVKVVFIEIRKNNNSNEHHRRGLLLRFRV